jgi:hypothetical protein
MFSRLVESNSIRTGMGEIGFAAFRCGGALLVEQPNEPARESKKKDESSSDRDLRSGNSGNGPPTVCRSHQRGYGTGLVANSIAKRL